VRNVTFSQWQPVYAEHGIATIPFSPEKKPLVKHPQKFGLRGSASLTDKFGDVERFAMYAGHRNKVSGIDVDVADETVLIDAIDRHGHTPIVTRSGSGHFHAWYKYNGERRRIRPWKKDEGLDIDLLGAGGFIIVPPSVGSTGGYEFIQGCLDDIPYLPTMQGLSADDYVGYQCPNDELPKAVADRPLDWGSLRDGHGRNEALRGLLARAVGGMDSLDQLLHYARAANEQLGQPMSDARVISTANSVWKMHCEGRNWAGKHGSFSTVDEIRDFGGDADSFYLLSFLRGGNSADSTFMITNSLSEQFGWQRKRLAGARDRLIERRIIRQVAYAGKGRAALYRWTNPAKDPPLSYLTERQEQAGLVRLIG
jgi:hypothetical protein